MEDESRREMLQNAFAAAVVAVLAQTSNAQDNSARRSDTTASPQSATSPPEMLNQVQSQIDFIKQHLEKMAQLANQIPSAQPIQPLSARDPKTWSQLQDRAGSYLNLTKAHLESGFRFVANDEDLTFRMQHTELLLDQMAELLERGLAARAAWNQLHAAAFNVKLQLQNYFELDTLHQEETVSGFYEHTPREAELQAAADFLIKMGLEGQAQYLKFMADYIDSGRNIFVNNNTLLAYISHLADYSTGAQGELMKYDNFVTSQKQTTPDMAKLAANALSNLSVGLQNLEHGAHLGAIGGSIPPAEQKARASSVRSAWEAKNAGFLLRRTEIGRRLADSKADAYTLPGGPLNYPEQMARLELRFSRDFRDALARLTAAADGISKLYGFTEPIPKSVSAVLEGAKPDPMAYDECLNWVRNAISYLVRFSQLDQRYSLSLSIKALIGPDKFIEGRTHREWADWTITVPRARFKDQYYVRLRGMTLYTVGNRSGGVWLGNVRPPAKSFCERLSSQGPIQQDLDQTNIPSTMAGRVTYREHVRPPDLVGGSTFYNVSPFGDWQIKLYQTSSEGASVDSIEDVCFDLHLAVRMKG